MRSEFRVTVEWVGPERAVVVLRGPLDIGARPALRGALAEAVDSGAVGLVADLGDVTFIDTSGFSALMWAVKRLKVRGGRLVLVTDDPSVLRMLKVMALDGVMPPFPTRGEALASLLFAGD